MIEFQQKFIDDANELLVELERDVLQVEGNEDSEEIIDRIFRVMHTLKGASSMFGFEAIGQLTHELEDIYVRIRDKEKKLTRDIISTTLQSVDIMRRILSDPQITDNSLQNDLRDLEKQIENLLHDSDTKPKQQQVQRVEKSEDYKTYYILFEPDADINDRGVNLNSLFDELKEIGNCRIFPMSSNDSTDEEKFYLRWKIIISSNKTKQEIEDVFLFVQFEYSIEELASLNMFDKPEFEAYIDSVCEKPEEISGDKLKETCVDILTLKKPVEKTAVAQFESKKTQSIRVSADKLDELMNLVSELITRQAELKLHTNKVEDIALDSISEDFQKLISSLRNNALNLRLVPIAVMLTQFKRLVRDLSFGLAKEIVLHIEGSETELDKTIIDSLNSPMLHIIRNSIDHGIETVEERKAQKKSPTGTISIRAYYSGAYVYISIQDDGRGINIKRVREKAIEKGLITKETELTNRELVNLVTKSGFSTAENVTEVSGRGVGMDVVAKKITEMRGKLEIETETNVGTTITIKIPQTLSIVDTLLVRCANSFFLIPLSLVIECTTVSAIEVDAKINKHIAINGELLPYILLRNEFSLEGNLPKKHKVVIVREEKQKVAIIVDKVVGEHQAVLKPLGKVFARHDYLSGGSLLGNGKLALMLDTNKLASIIFKENRLTH